MQSNLILFENKIFLFQAEINTAGPKRHIGKKMFLRITNE
jgi:small nuclear ribonucleoprotein (snRNP)-like protein